MSSEIYSHLYNKILQEGALDIYTESIYMKKNRPAVKVSVICKEDDLEKITEHLLKETSTFGVRYSKYDRVTLKREFRKIETIYGKVSVKLGYYKGHLIKVTPEYEDCIKIADNYGISFTKILLEINNIIYKEFNIKILT